MPVMAIEITEIAPPDISKRALTNITREGQRAMGMHWQRHFLPLHFKVGAESKYGYKPRSPKYLERKRRGATSKQDYVRRKLGYTEKALRVTISARPLVLTGALEKAMKRRHIVKAFPTRFTISMFAPHYISMRPRKPNTPAVGQEIIATVESERRSLTQVYDKSTTTALNKVRAAKRTVISS